MIYIISMQWQETCFFVGNKNCQRVFLDVRQPYDNFDKMYDSAIITLQKLEQSMLEIGSSCIQNFEASSTPSDEYDHNNQQQHVMLLIALRF